MEVLFTELLLNKFFGESIKIQTSDDNNFVFKHDEVEKIVKEPVLTFSDNDDDDENSPRLPYPNKGYRGFAEYGAQISVSKYGNSCPSLAIVHGFQFNPNFFIGLGLMHENHF